MNLRGGFKKTQATLILAAVGLLTAACATSNHAPKAPSSPTAPAHEDGDDTMDDADSDGEAEATSELPLSTSATDPSSPCPANMVVVTNSEGARFCIDKYEASLVEVDADGKEKPYPHWLPVDGHTVRAVSVPDVFPQGYISEVQAEDACAASNKRLCSHVEWKTACMGPAKTTFPYGEARKPGVCHDQGKSAVASVFGYQRLGDPTSTPQPVRVAQNTAQPAPGAAKNVKGSKADRKAHGTTKRAAESTFTRPTSATAARTTPATSKRAAVSGGKSKKKNAKSSSSGTAMMSRAVPAKSSSRPASVEPSVWSQLNDPRLGQVEGALSRTGSHDQCVNGFGAVDMVGNLHEWVKTDPNAAHGTFAGGYYLDTSINGDGCQYKTGAHAHDYHDYSTGFRCCADAK